MRQKEKTFLEETFQQNNIAKLRALMQMKDPAKGKEKISYIRSPLLKLYKKKLQLPAETVFDVLYESGDLSNAIKKMNELLDRTVERKWTKDNNRGKSIVRQTPTFEKLFKSQEVYERVISIMIENNHVDPNSLRWIDSRGKQILANIFRTCVKNKRFKSEKFETKIVRTVARNTFKVSLSEDTVKKSVAYNVVDETYGKI